MIMILLSLEVSETSTMSGQRLVVWIISFRSNPKPLTFQFWVQKVCSLLLSLCLDFDIFRCEQQLLYSLAPDVYLMRALPGEEVNIEESKDVKEIKSKGSGIHLARGK